jgi:uncharacterized protein
MDQRRPTLYPRIIERLVERELLPVFPAILVVGPRGCGKSTSMTRFADTVLDLSEPGVRMAVQEDPDGVLATSNGTVLVDEWQEAPEVLGAIKRAVDSDRSGRPGRFIVAGSVRAAHQASTWPGTGRLIRVRMYGLTQAELEGRPEFNPVDVFFGADTAGSERSDLMRADYVERLVAGRFPVTVGLEGRNRSRWYRAYIDQLIDRDAAQVAGRAVPAHKLGAVFGSCAARTGRELNKQATASDAGVDFRTADGYLDLLEALSVVVRVPAWHTSRLHRLTRAPKVHVIDPGMAAHVLNVDGEVLGRDPRLVGQLFETFVVSGLLAHLEATTVETSMFHLRDRDGKEVDVVLERQGRVVGLEVKSSTAVDRGDARQLLWLRDRLGEAFVFGAVLYSGRIPFEIDDRVWALPISSLWRHSTRSP